MYLNFQPLEVVSRYRDPQPQVVENYSYLFNLWLNIYKYCCLNPHFIPNTKWLFCCLQTHPYMVQNPNYPYAPVANMPGILSGVDAAGNPTTSMPVTGVPTSAAPNMQSMMPATISQQPKLQRPDRLEVYPPPSHTRHTPHARWGAASVLLSCIILHFSVATYVQDITVQMYQNYVRHRGLFGSSYEMVLFVKYISMTLAIGRNPCPWVYITWLQLTNI